MDFGKGDLWSFNFLFDFSIFDFIFIALCLTLVWIILAWLKGNKKTLKGLKDVFDDEKGK